MRFVDKHKKGWASGNIFKVEYNDEWKVEYYPALLVVMKVTSSRASHIIEWIVRFIALFW